MTRYLARTFLALLLLSALAACATEPETYPVSGEPCSPDDPVQDVSVVKCTPAP